MPRALLLNVVEPRTRRSPPLILRDLGTSVSSGKRPHATAPEPLGLCTERVEGGSGRPRAAVLPEERSLLTRPVSPGQSRQEPRTGDPGVTAAQPLAKASAGCRATERKAASACSHWRGCRCPRHQEPAQLLIRGFGQTCFSSRIWLNFERTGRERPRPALPPPPRPPSFCHHLSGCFSWKQSPGHLLLRPSLRPLPALLRRGCSERPPWGGLHES